MNNTLLIDGEVSLDIPMDGEYDKVIGIPGPKGDKGDQGEPGPKGDKGDTGPKGDKGDTGATGAKGDQGEPGPKGDKGDTGPKGDKGDTGATGAKGDKGDNGNDYILTPSDKEEIADIVVNEVIQKADMIKDTASGAVCSFPDGANDVPMDSLKVKIEPVQDLHGYDNPWPAGGGKNLLPPLTSETKNGVSISVADDGTITVNGTASTNVYFDAGLSGVIPNNTTFYLYAFNPIASTDSNNMSVFIITNSGNPQVNLNSVNASISYSYTTGDKQISKWRLKVPAGVDYANFVLKPMFQIGGTAPTAYSPYSNICPISGLTGAQVMRTGKNLLNPEEYGKALPFKQNGITFSKSANGNYHASGTATGSAFFNLTFNYANDPVMPATPYIGHNLFVNVGNSKIECYLGYFKQDKTHMQLTNGNIIPKDAVGLRCYAVIRQGTTIDDDFYPQIEVGSTATDYEPYTSNTYSVSWETEAGPVYGGTLDVTNGVLTVDRAIVDLGTLTWSKVGTNGNRWYALADNLAVKANATSSNLICTDYPSGNAGFALANDSMNCVAYCYEGSSRIAIKDITKQDYTAEQFASAVSGVKCVYELATPQTYHLTPQEVRTLLGQNNVWADTGDTEVTYSCDTKLYISKVITNALERD